MVTPTVAAPECEDSTGDWLAATPRGLWRGWPGERWQPLGGYEVHCNCILRQSDAIVIGGDGGLWQARRGERLWRQLHDEVLTMVQDVAPAPGDPGLLAATAYGVHTARRGEHGALRWQGRGEGLPTLGARFALVLQALDDAGQAWLVGTEDGLWRTDAGGGRWARTPVDGPVRALARGRGGLWAGTDAGGLWRSDDGARWRRSGASPGDRPLLSLAELSDGSLLAGTTHGVARGDGGAWESSGPPLAAVAVAAAPDGTWVFGACPGGLWWTRDGGRRWTQALEIAACVKDVAAP